MIRDKPTVGGWLGWGLVCRDHFRPCDAAALLSCPTWLAFALSFSTVNHRAELLVSPGMDLLVGPEQGLTAPSGTQPL